MFAILHAFILKHEGWSGGVVCVAYDNSSVVDALNEHSIRGTAIGPLQRILLIACSTFRSLPSGFHRDRTCWRMQHLVLITIDLLTWACISRPPTPSALAPEAAFLLDELIFPRMSGVIRGPGPNL
jgi:hypothetical protein